MNNKRRSPIPEGGPTFPLAKCIADQLGDVPAETPVTLAMFERCIMRLVDIKTGRLKRPSPADVGSGNKPEVGGRDAGVPGQPTRNSSEIAQCAVKNGRFSILPES